MTSRFLLVVVLLALPSCGSRSGSGTASGPGGAEGGTTNVALLIHDAPTDELSTFEITLRGFQLLQPDGTAGKNLLPAPRLLNLLELSDRSALVQVSSVRQGLLGGVRLVFATDSVVARDRAGDPVPVRVQSAFAVGSFAEPVALDARGFAKVQVDIDLDASLQDDPQVPGGLRMNPVIDPTLDLEDDDRLATIHGYLALAHRQSQQLEMRVLDRSEDATVGNLRVQLSSQTVLRDLDGRSFADQQAFFERLRLGTRLAVDGELQAQGLLRASMIKIEGFEDSVAIVTGTVVDLDTPAQTLLFRLREIEVGRRHVLPVLADLGDPNSISVSFTHAALLVNQPVPRPAESGELRVGQQLRVRFRAFQTAPFPARRLELEHLLPYVEGFIADANALPTSLRVTLRPGEAAITAGLVESHETEIDLLLDGRERLYLKLPHEPLLAPRDLLAGQAFRVQGNLSGSPSAPQLTATEIRVRPGRLYGSVQSSDESLDSFSVEIDRVEDPFGGPSLSGLVPVAFARDAVVRGDARSPAEFFQLARQLGEQALEVMLAGILDPAAGILVFEAQVQVP
jgi:hypothetical protein